MTGYTSGDISYSYTYDAEGVRRSKQNDNVQGSKITYISDTLCEYSQTLAEINATGELDTSYTIGLELISLTRGGEEYYYISDGHGDVRFITDEDCHIKTKYRYSGYGELIDTSGDIENSHMYAGECYDEESGLYYLRARYMNPSTGTFTGMDSYAGNISDPDTLHKYLYANGNPVKYVDPSGNSPTFQEQLTAIGISRELDAQKLIILGGVFNTIVKSTVTFIEGGNVLEIILAAFQGFSFGGLFIAANIIFACIFGVLLVDIFIAEGIGYGYKDIYNAIECFQNGHPEYAWCYIASAAGNFTLAGCLGYIKIKAPSTSELKNNAEKNAGKTEGGSGSRLYRKISNTGEFKGLQEAMQTRNVIKIAKKAGIGLDGVKIKIDRNAELMGKGVYGYTDGKTITLYPDAFTDTETLVKTLGHERMHVYQISVFGKPISSELLQEFESGAYASESIWWQYFQSGGK